MKCFLLRYQEQILEDREPAKLEGDSSSAGPASSGSRLTKGTKSVTNVKAEASDADATSATFRAFPHLNGLPGGSGTQTFTAVRAEAVDADPGKPSYDVLPRVVKNAATQGEASGTPPSLGTKTLTEVRVEQADQDPGHEKLCVIPRCSSS